MSEDGTVTDRGRDISRVAADPRLARALLDGASVVGARRAAEVVALLSEDVRTPGGDLVAALRSLRRGGPASSSWSSAARQLQAALPRDVRAHDGERGLPDDVAVGLVVALAHPGRVARLRPGSTAYLMVSGTGAVFGPAGSALSGQAWLAVADVDRRPGMRDATIRSAAPLSEDLALEAAAALWHEDERVAWADGRVVARRSTRLGAIELASERIASPSPALVAAAVRDGLRAEGVAVLPWTEAASSLRARMAFLHRALGDPWPDVSDEALAAGVETWLGPGAVPHPGHARPPPGRRARRPAAAAALARRGPARRAGPRAGRRAERVAGAGGLRRGAARARRTHPGGVRLGRHPPPRRRPGAAAAAPALTGPPPGRGDRRPGVVLAHRLPRGAGRAPGPLPASTPGRRTPGPRRPPAASAAPDSP